MTTDFDHEEGKEVEYGISSALILARFKKFYRVLIWLVVLAMVVAALFLAFARPLGFVRYTAKATVGPASSDAGGNLISAISGVSGYGLLGGKSILSSLSGNSGTGDFDQYIQILTSVKLAKVLIEEGHILPVVFSSKWDAESNSWIARDAVHQRIIDGIKGLLSIPVKPHPDVDNLVTFLSDNLVVNTSYTSSFVNLSFTFKDPNEAERILGAIIRYADNLIREAKRADVSARTKYLRGQLLEISDMSERETAISLLATQQQMMVMVEADKNYSMSIIDDPNTSLTPTEPKPTFVIIICLMLAFICWCLLIFSLREDHVLLRLTNKGIPFSKR